MWSEYLFKEGLVPNGYNGLPNNLLISNFRQEGYLSGMHDGYVLAMMAMVDNNVSKEIVIAVRDFIRSNSVGHRYDEENKFLDMYKNEKYSWIDKA